MINYLVLVRRRDQRSEPLDELRRAERERDRSVRPRTLQMKPQGAIRVLLQPPLRQRRTRDVPTEPLQPLAVLRADDHPRVHRVAISGSAARRKRMRSPTQHLDAPGPSTAPKDGAPHHGCSLYRRLDIVRVLLQAQSPRETHAAPTTPPRDPPPARPGALPPRWWGDAPDTNAARPCAGRVRTVRPAPGCGSEDSDSAPPRIAG